MSLRTEIVPYIDGEGFVAPSLVEPPGAMRGSDNGPMFTAELYVMYQKLGQLVNQDPFDYANKINANIDSNGLLNRHHIGTSNGQEGPDDYVGVLDGCKILGNTDIPRRFLWAVIKFKGSLNNANPGHWSWSSFLIRQPQLLGSMMAAAFPSWKNPLHIILRLLTWPVFLAAAISIGISCINAPLSDTDSRRLAWHLWQTTKPVSLMCWLAGKIWLRRLYKDFPNGMLGVAAIYYQQGHPFAKYWITE